MDWLIGELFMLAVPGYFFLQLLIGLRYRGRWLIFALLPLLIMVPLVIHAGFGLAAGSNMWPVLVILASPVAFVYLVGLAAAKAQFG